MFGVYYPRFYSLRLVSTLAVCLNIILSGFHPFIPTNWGSIWFFWGKCKSLHWAESFSGPQHMDSLKCFDRVVWFFCGSSSKLWSIWRGKEGHKLIQCSQRNGNQGTGEKSRKRGETANGGKKRKRDWSDGRCQLLPVKYVMGDGIIYTKTHLNADRCLFVKPVTTSLQFCL